MKKFYSDDFEEFGATLFAPLVFTHEKATDFLMAKPVVNSYSNDDYTGGTDTSGSIIIDGGTQSGEIEISGDEDWFEIVVQNDGDIVGFSADFEGTSFYRFSIAIFDEAGGAVLSPSQFYKTRNLFFTFETAGTYYVSLSDTTSGTYEFSAYSVVDEVGSDVNDHGVAVVDGAAVLGSLDHSNDTDWYAITIAEAQDIIAVNVVGFTGAWNYLDIEILDANGQSVSARSLHTIGSTKYAVFDEAGTFFISVSANGQHGDFSLDIDTVVDDYTADTNTTGVIVVDGASVSGAIDYDRDEDWIAFDVVDNEQIIKFTLDALSTQNYVYLEVLDTDGNTVQIATTMTVGAANAYLFDPGRYYMKVSHPDDILDYTFSAVELQDDFGDDVDTATLILPDNSNVEGNFDYNGDSDWFEFEIANDGEVLGFHLGEAVGYTRFTIYNSSGGTVGSSATWNGRTYFYGLQDAGTYYLELKDNFQWVGAYEFALEIIDDDYANDVSTEGVININGGIVNGRIDYRGDHDWFRLEASEGDFVGFKVDGLVDSIALSFYVLDEAGQILNVYRDVALNDIAAHTFEASGTHYLHVLNGSTTSSDYINYSVSVAHINDDYSNDAATLGVKALDGTATTGRMDYTGDVDWFTIDIKDPDQVLNFIAAEDHKPSINLLDADGNILKNYNSLVDINGLTHNFDDVGTYYLAVSSGNSGETYSLTVSEVEDDFASSIRTAGLIEVDGANAAGKVEFNGDSDWFEIQITESGQTVALTRYLIPGSGYSSTYRPTNDLIIRDANGVELSILNYWSTYRFSDPGTYFVSFASSASVLNYKLFATSVTDSLSISVSLEEGFAMDSSRQMFYKFDDANDSLLRYDMESESFLPELDIGGDIAGLVMSADNQFLYVAHSGYSQENAGKLLVQRVDLDNWTISDFIIETDNLNSNILDLEMGLDGNLIITSDMNAEGEFIRVGLSGFSEDLPLELVTLPSANNYFTGYTEHISNSQEHRMFVQSGVTGSSFIVVDNETQDFVMSSGALYFGNYGNNRGGSTISSELQLVVISTRVNPIVIDFQGNRVANLEELLGTEVVYEFSADAQHLFAASDFSSVIEIYETNTFKKIGQFQLEARPGQNLVLDVTPDGNFLLVGGDLGSYALNLHEVFSLDVTGNDIAESFLGSLNADTFDGNLGNDYIKGNKGDDLLAGGEGFDRFIFNEDDGVDTITDFEIGIDVIEFLHFDAYTSVAELRAMMSVDGDDVLIDMGDGNSIRLNNVDIADLDASHFRFGEDHPDGIGPFREGRVFVDDGIDKSAPPAQEKPDVVPVSEPDDGADAFMFKDVESSDIIADVLDDSELSDVTGEFTATPEQIAAFELAQIANQHEADPLYYVNDWGILGIFTPDDDDYWAEVV